MAKILHLLAIVSGICAQQPVIRTSDGNVIVEVGADKQMTIKIGNDAPVDIAGIPEEAKTYSDDTLRSFGLGFQTASANDNTDKLLQYFNDTFMNNERTAKQGYEDLGNDLRSEYDEFTKTLDAYATKVDLQTLRDTINELNKSVLALAKTQPTPDGTSDKNAAPSCKAIKANFPSSKSGQYYITYPQPSRSSQSGMSFFRRSADYIRVYCNFESGFTYNGTNNNPFRADYFDGMTSPHELVTFNAKYVFTAYGAAGGRGMNSPNGGKGGMAGGRKSFDRGDVIYLYPGGRGGRGYYADNSNYNTAHNDMYHMGGWNGGGRGTQGGSGGGGASDVRTQRHDLKSRTQTQNSLKSRLLVAGGGGGCGSGTCSQRGGSGGDSTGEASNGAYGGSQTQGGRNSCGYSSSYGMFGFGGDVQYSHTRNDAGGGGGGYYGGSAGCTSNRPGGGGAGYYGGMDQGNRRFARAQNDGNGYILFYWQDE